MPDVQRTCAAVRHVRHASRSDSRWLEERGFDIDEDEFNRTFDARFKSCNKLAESERPKQKAKTNPFTLNLLSAFEVEFRRIRNHAR